MLSTEFVNDYGPFAVALFKHLDCGFEELQDCTKDFYREGEDDDQRGLPRTFRVWFSMTDMQDPTRTFNAGSMYFGSVESVKYVIRFDWDLVIVWKKNA